MLLSHSPLSHAPLSSVQTTGATPVEISGVVVRQVGRVVSGVMAVQVQVAGSPTLQGRVYGRLRPSIMVNGAVVSKTKVSGTFDCAVTLRGAVALRGIASGLFGEQIGFNGSVIKKGTASGQLKAAAVFSGSKVYRGRAAGSIKQGAYLTSSITLRPAVEGALAVFQPPAVPVVEVFLKGRVKASLSATGHVDFYTLLTGSVLVKPVAIGKFGVAINGAVRPLPAIGGRLEHTVDDTEPETMYCRQRLNLTTAKPVIEVMYV